MAEKGQLDPIVDKGFYTLETVQVAYDAIMNAKTKGKVVISVS